jgi:small-conductance mechanosensitive channel
VLGVAVVVGLVSHWVFIYVVSRIERRTSSLLSYSILSHCQGPSRIVFTLVSVLLSLPFLDLPELTVNAIGDTAFVLLVASVTWLFVRLIHVIEDLVLAKYDIRQKDNLQARRIHTQFGILKRILIVIVAIFGLAAALMSFEKFRTLGAGILASAGVLGLVVGLAAQRIIGNLLAGIQLAVTQPIRLDDVVIVENELGRVEDISLTYVVLKLWDLRRLVLPISYFIEKPFQNWTRTRADLLGTVLFYVDYSVPVQAIRDELHLILKGSSLWDEKVWGLEVTNTTERAVELRALMSARNSEDMWNLRCEVREKLIAFIQKTYPHALPKIRASLEEGSSEEAIPPGLRETGGVERVEQNTTGVGNDTGEKIDHHES